MKFEHQFEEEDINSGILFTENFVVSEESLEVTYSETDGVWLSGNKEGLLKLAKILIETAHRNNESTHSHFTSDFKLQSKKKPEFTIELNID